MTFQEALTSLRDPNGNASQEGLALAEQVEANRKAIEELRREMQHAVWSNPRLSGHGY